MSSALVNTPEYLSHPLFTEDLDHVDYVIGEGNGIEYPVPVPSQARIRACCKLIRKENDGKRRSMIKFGVSRYDPNEDDQDDDDY